MTGVGLYTAYGLVVASNRPLPGAMCVTAEIAADLTIDFRRDLPPSTDSAALLTRESEGWQSTTRTDRGGLVFRCASDRGTRAWTLELSPDGSRMEVRSTPEIADDVMSYVITRGLAASLVLRGTPLLHACAIEVPGGAMLVVGGSGAGKSTLAGVALASGLAVLADDMAALTWRDDGLHVESGLAQMRLDDSTAASLEWDPSTLSPVFSDPRLPRKRRIELSPDDGSFCPCARPVRAIVVLGERSLDGPRIARRSPAEALPLLLAHAFATDLLDRPGIAATLPFWARVAREVPLHEVRAAPDLQSLPALTRTVVSVTTTSAHGERPID